MALGETARLVAALELQDKFSGPMKGAIGTLGKAEGSFKRIGGMAAQGVRTATTRIAALGAVAAGGVVLAVRSGLDSLAQLESATTQVQGAIDQMGLQGKVSADEVARWANDIEGAVGAAFDDKDITSASATLLRFGRVTPGNLRPAMEVMTDLAAKTGSVDSAASLLAKALADPEKAAGKLAKSGVILTKAQQDQIKAMVAAGDAAGAQKYILDQLAVATTGAAAASQGPYQRSLSLLKDTWEDVTKALAIGFLPVIQKVADYLRGKLADQGFLKRVEDFGRSMADFLGRGLDALEKIDWSLVENAFKAVGLGAKAAYDLFTGLPPWVQTAVLTGWGLNKLTGGALSGIVGELGKGLIKGVMSVTAASMQVKAGSVVVAGPAGGAPGGGGAVVGGKGGLGTVGKLAVGAGVIAEIAAIAVVFKDLEANTARQSADVLKVVATIPDKTYAQALQAAKDLEGNIAANQTDLVKGLAMATGTGQKEAVASFQALADNLNKTARTPEERAAAQATLQALADRLEAAFHRTDVPAEQSVARLDEVVALLSAPPPPAGPATVVPGPGFTEWMHSQQSQGDSSLQAQRDLYDSNKNGLVTLREVMAAKLGLTVAEIGALKQASGGWNATLAAKLGISNTALQGIKGEASDTVTAIRNKDWSPTVNVDVTSRNTFTVSGREVAGAVVRSGYVLHPRVN